MGRIVGIEPKKKKAAKPAKKAAQAPSEAAVAEEKAKGAE